MLGTVKRTKPRVNVLRGLDLQNPVVRTAAARVADGVTLLSGQVCSKQWNNTDSVYEWVKGGLAGAVPHIAYQDSADVDVVEAAALTGLDCSGQFRIQTAYFKAEETYNDGVYLTYDGTTGDVKPTTLESGEPILGRCSAGLRGPKDLGPNADTGAPGVDSSATDLEVVIFDTMYLPNSADAVE